MPQDRFSFGKFGGRAGVGLAALGLLVIGLGINGASGQLTVLAQVPYLVSGGMLGLALVVLGAAMLVVQGGREDRALLEAKLDLIAEAFLEGQGQGQGRSTRPTTPTDLSGLVVAGSASYHLPDCRLVEGREHADYLTPAEAQAAALRACRVCSPPQPGDTAPPVTVVARDPWDVPSDEVTTALKTSRRR